MKVETRDIRPASKVGRAFGAVTDEVESGRTIVILKNNRPVGGVVPMSVLDRLDDIDERESDLRLLAVALSRLATDQGKRYTLGDSAALLGVDLDDLDDESER